jgi:hypothetical protein
VVKGDPGPLVGDAVIEVRESCFGEVAEVGPEDASGTGTGLVFGPRELLRSFAVMVMYLAALDPSEIFSDKAALGVFALAAAAAVGRGLVEGVLKDGILVVEAEGVARPFANEAEGVRDVA